MPAPKKAGCVEPFWAVRHELISVAAEDHGNMKLTVARVMGAVSVRSFIHPSVDATLNATSQFRVSVPALVNHKVIRKSEELLWCEVGEPQKRKPSTTPVMAPKTPPVKKAKTE